jgi:hypothetical protein
MSITTPASVTPGRPAVRSRMVPRRLVPILAVSVLAVIAMMIVTSAANAARRQAPTTSDCTASPVPDGCVTSIKYVDPSTVTAVARPDGTVAGTWDPKAPGTVEKLPAPLPAADAAALASQRAASHGLQITAPTPAPAAPDTRAKAKAAQYGNGDCTYIAYTIWFVALDSYNAHYHFESQQYCGTNEEAHGVTVVPYRDSTSKPGDSEAAFGGYWATAAGFGNCHAAGDHTWWNWSSFWAETESRGIVQGPAGYFTSTTKRYY